MSNAADRLKDFYRQELAALRDEAAEFAQDHPDQAAALGFQRGRSQDPQVEMLMQSFAYLTGRLRNQMEIDQAQLPNALLADLYPHLAAPLPSMLVAQLEVQPDGVGTIARGRGVVAQIQTHTGNETSCRFRTCFETPLWPLSVFDVAIVSPEDYPELARNPEVRSVLRVRLRKHGRTLLRQMQPTALRFHLNQEAGPAQALHQMLGAHLLGVAVNEEPETHGLIRVLPKGCFRWLGFEDDEAALPSHPQAHPAFRILQEYFAFPEKFLFFEIDSMRLEVASDRVDLLFMLDVPPNPALNMSPKLVRTNCVPLVNLYPQRIDPLSLDHTRYEYRLTGDIAQHSSCEIYSIEKLHAIRAGEAPRELVPYFSMQNFHRIEELDYFYIIRREACRRAKIGGTEIYVSFLDAHFQMTDPADDVIGGTAICTNRRLPERLRVGDLMQIEGAAPLSEIRVLSKPTAHQSPPMIGSRPWLLVSQLALNHLSLSSGPHAIASLKEILHQHVGPSSTLGHRVIDGIRALDTRPLVRWHGEPGKRGFVQGVEIDVTLEHHQFEDCSAVLFCSVLRHFFALYAAVNTIVQVRLFKPNHKGVLKAWPPLAGNQVLL